MNMLLSIHWMNLRKHSDSKKSIPFIINLRTIIKRVQSTCDLPMENRRCSVSSLRRSEGVPFA